ncbi:MAG: DUF2332 domain-containing protein [Actinomycetia bacterium]|nr:DUF2332 domain-containing protein [Actinomycetes bacterium]MCP4085268.1 DUF2332 domain-containing protein [Actinomycetes bacterium]
MDTREWYNLFAEHEAAGSSPTYERLARAVGESQPLVALLEELPAPKRQPNLLFASARLLGAPIDDPPAFITYVLSSWDEVAAVMQERSTQTNEAARTGTLLPVIAQISGPIALIEVGCSAGLCLYPDRYAISYDGQPALARHSTVHIDVATNGSVLIPTILPDVVARIGVDLNPLDVNDLADRSWLEALIWPEHNTRLARLRAATSIVAHDPPVLLRGDLVETIDQALALVPSGATPIVFHSAVLNYISSEDRKRFAEQLSSHTEVVWISNEGPGVIDGLASHLRPPLGAGSAAFFITGRNGSDVIGISDPHGTWISW